MARPRRLLTVLAAASRASAFDVPFFGFNWKELVIGGAGVDPKDGVLGRVQVKSDPLAVCNDGSPAVYYLKEGDPTLWLVYLEGGGWCYDEQTCTKRAQVSPKMTSSNGYPETVAMDGIFSTDPQRSPIPEATKVFVKYCSSDAHAGDVGKEDGGALGWHFRGKRIVDAVFSELISDWGLGNSPGGTTVVFGGTSAGGRGAMFHLDAVRRRLESSGAAQPSLGPTRGARPRVQVVGVLDSPLWLDMPPLYESLVPMQEQTELIRKLAGIAHPDVLDPACAQAFPPGEQWKCLYGEYRIDFVTTRYALFASSYDSYQLGQLLGHRPSTKAEFLLAEDFAAKTRRKLAELPSKRQRQDSVIYSQACYNHAVSFYEDFYRAKTSDGVSERDCLAKSILRRFADLQQPRRDTGPATIDAGLAEAEAAANESKRRLLRGQGGGQGGGPGGGTRAGEGRGWWVDSCEGGFACGAGCAAKAEDIISRGKSTLAQRWSAINPH